MKTIALTLLTALVLWGCEDSDPTSTPITDAGLGGGGGEGGGAGGEGGAPDGERCDRPEDTYPGESWPACVSDDGVYVLAGDTVPSSAARVAAYEAIADLLWRGGSPTREAFIQAQLIYGEDGGVGSRISRRYDSHITKPEGADCKAEDAAERWPEYCVGPGQIEPLLLDAFQAGIDGAEPLERAAQIEAGLLWFYYVSAFKEASTCAGKAADCDSAWAYFSGGKQSDETNLGLAGRIQAIDTQAHADVHDGLLALRCWRHLDGAEVAQDPEMHQRALGQLDVSLDRGLALVLSGRLDAYDAATDTQRPAIQSGLRVLAPVLGRALGARGDALQAAVERSPLDTEGARAALSVLTSCP